MVRDRTREVRKGKRNIQCQVKELCRVLKVVQLLVGVGAGERG